MLDKVTQTSGYVNQEMLIAGGVCNCEMLSKRTIAEHTG